MFEQRGEEGRDERTIPEGREDAPRADAPRPAERYRCYSLEVLMLLED